MNALIDAFWKGRGRLKRARGVFFDSEKSPKKACYIGAIYYGLYQNTADKYSVVNLIAYDWPQIRYWAKPPCECDNEGKVSAILIHLNDDHRWTDQKISEWLASAKIYESWEEFDKDMS